jgi:spermidine synthase
MTGPASRAIGAFLLAALAVVTWRRQHAFLDAETLWRDTLRQNPGAFIAHHNLGAILLERGDLDGAAGAFEATLRIRPDFAESLDNLGVIRERQGKIDEATSYFDKALRSDPTLADAHNNLGIVLAEQGKSGEAIDHFRQAIRVKPGLASAHRNLALALERAGRAGEAVPEYREALRWSPGVPGVALRLAWILATDADPHVRNGAEAVRLAQATSAASGDRDPQALDVLAAAYAESGRFDDAVRSAERALDLAGPTASADAKAGAAARLDLYRSHRPFRSATP